MSQLGRVVGPSVLLVGLALTSFAGCSASTEANNGPVPCSSATRCETASCAVDVDVQCNYSCGGTSACTVAGGRAAATKDESGNREEHKLECSIQSRCDLTSPGSWELMCSNSATCVAHAPKEAVYKVSCGNEASCDVTCEASSSCAVTCTNGAKCNVTCTTGATCSCTSGNGAECTCKGDGCTTADGASDASDSSDTSDSDG